MEPLRFSRLRLMSKSPAHYRHAEVSTTSAMDVGSAVDSVLLGGPRVLAYPGATRRGKEWEAFKAANDGALILTQREFALALGMAESVHGCDDAMLLLKGVRQQAVFWSNNGRACRGTVDVRGDGYITELKSGETADPRRFPWKVRDFAYHAALAWYQDGLERAGFDRPENCYIVAVEQAAPFAVTCFELDPATLEMGGRLWRTWFEALQTCEASNQWPAYAQSIVPLALPDDTDIVMLDADEVAADA